MTLRTLQVNLLDPFGNMEALCESKPNTDPA